MALNTLTRQQSWAAELLAQHAGKTIRLIVAGVQLNWGIEHDGRLMRASEGVSPDVTLEIEIDKFDPLSLFGQTRKPDMAEYVHVTGQAALAQVMSKLARGLRPDPEDALARWIGDVPARRAVRGAQQLLVAVQTLGASLSHNLAEYLSEETEALVGTPALLTQQSTQTKLLASLDRLEQRQMGLQARILRLERSAGVRK